MCTSCTFVPSVQVSVCEDRPSHCNTGKRYYTCAFGTVSNILSASGVMPVPLDLAPAPSWPCSARWTPMVSWRFPLQLSLGIP